MSPTFIAEKLLCRYNLLTPIFSAFSVAAIKVFSCAFSGSFTLQDWSRVSQWVMSLSLRKLEGPQLGPGGRLELTGGSTSSLAISSRRSSRHSSVSSVTGLLLRYTSIPIYINFLGFFCWFFPIL